MGFDYPPPFYSQYFIEKITTMIAVISSEERSDFCDVDTARAVCVNGMILTLIGHTSVELHNDHTG